MKLKQIHIKTNKDLMEEPKLHLPSTMGGAEPFKVPDHYFDSLTSRIQDRISANEKKKFVYSNFLRGFLQKKIWIPSMAGVVLLFVVILMNTERNISTQNQISKTDSVIIKNSDLNNSYALEVQYIEAAKVLEQIELLPLNEISLGNLTLPDEIKNEDIRKYLNEEEIDPTLLADL
jgi:hypothetical protein